MAVSSLLEIPQNIALALSLASSATGADYDYLVQTAYRESRFEAKAQAPTSSAQGLFQFIEETWLMTVKNDGARFGLGDYANRIFKTRTGRHYVPDVKERKKILGLRRDPKISSLMAGVFARNNATRLTGEIGRNPTSGELYLAHFLGATDAIRMIKLARSRPNRKAASEFPAAAKANRSIFYDGKRARSARQVYLSLVRKHNQRGKNRKYIRTIAEKKSSATRRANLKRHLRSHASARALNSGKVRTAANRVLKGHKNWATVVRPDANLKAMLRGGISPHGASKASLRHARN